MHRSLIDIYSDIPILLEIVLISVIDAINCNGGGSGCCGDGNNVNGHVKFVVIGALYLRGAVL
jgi:hypothetical protein